MSEEKGKFPTKEVAIIGLGGGVIVGSVYLLYQYFIAPGNELVDLYKYIVSDTVAEIKEFGEENAKLAIPIYGLTSAQQSIIEEKKKILIQLEPYVQEVIGRGDAFLDWLYSVIVTGLIIAGVSAGVIAAFRVKWGNWKAKEEAYIFGSGDYVTHLCFDVMSNIFAYEGKLNIASGIYNQMQAYYSSYTAQSLIAQQAFYNSWLQVYSQTAWQYMFATQMLTTLAFEASVQGIMGVLRSFWLPPII